MSYEISNELHRELEREFELSRDYDVAVNAIMEREIERDDELALIRIGLRSLLRNLNGNLNREYKVEVEDDHLVGVGSPIGSPKPNPSRRNRASLEASSTEGFLNQRVYLGQKSFKLMRDCTKDDLGVAVAWHKAVAQGHNLKAGFYKKVGCRLQHKCVVGDQFTNEQLYDLYKAVRV